MKRNEPNQSAFSTMTKFIRVFFNSLFFHDSDREFQRLKNFIAS